MVYCVLEQVPEIRTDCRLTAADVDVEHLHRLELVDHRLALRCAQFARVAAPRRRQAVHARQIACVGQFPSEANGRVESEFELVDKGPAYWSHGQRTSTEPVGRGHDVVTDERR